MPKIWLDILIFFALLMAGLIALARHLQKVGVFFPSQDMPVSPLEMGLAYEDIYFKTKDNLKLNGWFFKAQKPKSTLIFAHGNAGNMCDRLFKIRFFLDLGINVFIFDYRGYGKSEGKPTEAGVYLDAQAAYDHLKSRGDIDMEKIILYGASLGGAVVADLATHREAALLVVESSFTSAVDMARVHYHFVPTFLVTLKFDSINKVKHLKTPKIFIHSPQDEVVPFWVGEKLFEAAAPPKEFLKIHGGHNDGSLTVDPTATIEFIRILKFLGLL